MNNITIKCLKDKGIFIKSENKDHQESINEALTIGSMVMERFLLDKGLPAGVDVISAPVKKKKK